MIVMDTSQKRKHCQTELYQHNFKWQQNQFLTAIFDTFLINASLYTLIKPPTTERYRFYTLHENKSMWIKRRDTPKQNSLHTSDLYYLLQYASMHCDCQLRQMQLPFLTCATFIPLHTLYTSYYHNTLHPTGETKYWQHRIRGKPTIPRGKKCLFTHSRCYTNLYTPYISSAIHTSNN